MPDLATFRKNAISEVIEREGGSKYTDRATDRGGPTRWGVTEKTARAAGYTGSMKELPESVAISIYQRNFWDFCKCDQLAAFSPELAVWVFDFAVNSGPPNAIAQLQTLLNVLNDRQRLYPDFAPAANIGPKTLDALAKYCKVRDIKTLAYAYNALRVAFLVNIAKSDESQESNVYGWLSRVISITKTVGL